MGQEFTSLDSEPSVAILTQLQSRFAILQHPSYSSTANLKLLNDRSSNQKYVLRIITTNNEHEHQRIEELINKKIANKCNYVTKLEQYFFEHEKSYCGNLSKCYLLFNVQQCITAKEYFQLKQSGKSTEEELLRALENLTNGLLWLKNIQTPHGNISSQNVYVIKDQFVLSDPWIAPEGADLTDRFPSPEKLMKINNKIEDYDLYVADLFSIGMTLLEVAKQQKLDKIYKKNYSLNTELLIEEISKCQHPRLREVIKYLLLSSENNRKQYLHDHELRYYIMQQQAKAEENVRREKSGIRRINMMSNRQNVKNAGLGPVNTHIEQPKNFSKENKIQSYYQQNNEQKVIPHQNVHIQQVPHQQPIVKEPQPQARPPSNSKVNFNYSPNLTLHQPPPILNNNFNPYSAIQNRNFNKVYNNLPKFTLISAPIEPKPSATRIPALCPKFVLDAESNVVKKLSFTEQLSDYCYQDFNKYHSQNNIIAYPNPPTYTQAALPKYTAVHSLNNIGVGLVESEVKQMEGTPLNFKPMTVPDSNSSEFNEYIHSLDEKINKFEVGVSNAIQNTIKQIQQTSQLKDKESFKTVEELRGSQKETKMNQPLEVALPIAESQLTSNSSVKLPESCEPIERDNRQSSQLNDSLLLQINRYASEEKLENKRDSEVISIATYAISPNTCLPEGENVLNSFEQAKQIRHEDESRNTIFHGTQIEVSNLTIPEQASSQQESFDSTVQKPEKDGVYCEQYFENGGIYQGLMKNGERNGKGIFHYRDGGYYQGQWRDNKMNGFGRLYYDSGELAYQGQWFKDEFHGRGKIYNDSPNTLTGPFDYRDFKDQDSFWKYYEGDMQYDAKQGHGKLILSNDEYYIGEFKSDRPNGRGHFYLSTKKVIHGIWSDGKLVTQM